MTKLPEFQNAGGLLNPEGKRRGSLEGRREKKRGATGGVAGGGGGRSCPTKGTLKARRETKLDVKSEEGNKAAKNVANKQLAVAGGFAGGAEQLELSWQLAGVAGDP